MNSIDLWIGRYPKLIGCRADILRASELLNAVLDKNYGKIFADVHRVVESARDLLIFWQDLI